MPGIRKSISRSRPNVFEMALAAATVLALGLGPTAVKAQAYPVKPVRVVVPYTSGSPVDILSRIVGQELSARVRQPIIVDNRPGAGTTIGIKAVASAAPDGYTLLVAGPSLVYSPLLYPNPGYEPLKSLVPVAPLVTWSHVLVVTPTVPVNSVEELVAFARTRPGKLNVAFGLGTVPQILSETFKAVTKTDINSVSYRGGAQAMTDILGGQVHMNFATTATLLPWIRQGKLRALAYTGVKRSRDLPDVPTMIESGFPQLAFNPDVWQGAFAPVGTAHAVISKLNAEIRESLMSSHVEATLAKLGFDSKMTSPQEFAVFLAAEAQKWPPLVRAAGVRPD